MKKVLIVSCLLVTSIITFTFAKTPNFNSFRKNIATRSQIERKDYPKKEYKKHNINGFEYSNIFLG